MRIDHLTTVICLVAGSSAGVVSSDTLRGLDRLAGYAPEIHAPLAAPRAAPQPVAANAAPEEGEPRAANAVASIPVPDVAVRPPPPEVPGSAEGEPGPEHSDSWLAWKIRGHLFINGNISAANTKVSVVNGVVVLTGTVATEAQRQLTESHAREIEGVKEVRDELVIRDDPAADSGRVVDDDDITSRVKYALLCHRTTCGLKTSVHTTDGVVHILGEANSDAERIIATRLALGVRGTKSVSNEMTLKE